MGPRFFKRGDVRLNNCPIWLARASMGPRFFKRGDLMRQSVALVMHLLQWGHASLSVETMGPRGARLTHHAASMGPRFFKRGDPVLDPLPPPASRASMGPRFFKRGDSQFLAKTSASRIALQWGHASLSVETGPNSRGSSPATNRFNGATLL